MIGILRGWGGERTREHGLLPCPHCKALSQRILCLLWFKQDRSFCHLWHTHSSVFFVVTLVHIANPSIWGTVSGPLSLIAVYSGPFPCEEAVVLGSVLPHFQFCEQDVQMWALAELLVRCLAPAAAVASCSSNWSRCNFHFTEVYGAHHKTGLNFIEIFFFPS